MHRSVVFSDLRCRKLCIHLAYLVCHRDISLPGVHTQFPCPLDVCVCMCVWVGVQYVCLLYVCALICADLRLCAC